MPLGPPTGTRITGRAVGGVTAEEMNVELPSCATVRRIRIAEAAIEIYGDEVPSRSECTFRQVSDEEHAVRALDDGFIQLLG